MSESMVERVARALYAIRMEVAEGAGLHEPYVWETDNNAYREHYLKEARAAIGAMREPSESMIEAGGEVLEASDIGLGDTFLSRATAESIARDVLIAALTNVGMRDTE